MVGDQVSGVPHFFGATATAAMGPHAGLRACREEDLARELMLALQGDQRRMARIAVEAPADIASRWDPVAARPSSAAFRTHGWTGCSVACSCRCSGSTSIGGPRRRQPGPDRHHRRRTRPGVLRAGRAGRARCWPLLRAQRSEPAHRVRQHPGPGQSHPLRGATCAATSLGDLLAQHYAGVRH